MAQTLYSKIKGFCTTQGNAPTVALALVYDATQHMLAHRDWDALAYFLGHAPSSMRGIARRIATEVIGGAELDVKSKVAKAHRCKVVWKLTDNMGPTDKMETLRQLVADGRGITSKEVREAFPAAAGEELSREEQIAAFAKRLKALEAKVKEEGFDMQDVMKVAHPEWAI